MIKLDDIMLAKVPNNAWPKAYEQQVFTEPFYVSFYVY